MGSVVVSKFDQFEYARLAPAAHFSGLGVRTNPLARGTLPRMANPTLLE